MREGFLRSDNPQSDKLRGRGDQLSLLSPPGIVLNLPQFHSLPVFRWESRGKREDRSCHLGVPRLSCSVSDLALTCSFSILLLFNSSLSCSLHFFSAFLLLYHFKSNFFSIPLSYSSSSNFQLLNFLIPVSYFPSFSYLVS